MKKIKLFFMALLSLLLPSCSNTPSPSQDNNSIVSGDIDNLNEFSENTSDSTETSPLEFSSSHRFPASSGTASGEKTSIIVSPEENITEENTNSEIQNLETQDFETQNLEIPDSETQNSEIYDSEATNNNDIPSPITASRELLATYSSKVYTKTEDRQKNLRIVCEKLSGTVLAPNEEFSYNETCGPYNKENGFGKATVFVGNGIEKEDYGGGVCQLSSTLYNAVKDLDVDVTERHLHSKKVYYVPDGEDATVSYGNLDFKFKNNYDFPLYFEANSNSEQVNVYVYKA